MRIATPQEKLDSRKNLFGAGFKHAGPVLGYIGGTTERKGYRQVISALEGESDVFLLMGGRGSHGFKAPTLHGRFKSIGLTDKMQEFYAACDVFAVPSYFDPCPLVVFEAAARGLPVIATDGVGNLPNLLENRCGAEWKFNTPITPIVHDLVARRLECHYGAARMSESLSMARWKASLLGAYQEILEAKGSGKG
jgi:glycosyltransferase involved in cell wall biosynthesis